MLRNARLHRLKPINGLLNIARLHSGHRSQAMPVHHLRSFSADEENLRTLFDEPQSQLKKFESFDINAGFLMVPGLKGPTDLIDFSNKCLEKSHILLKRILTDGAEGKELNKIVKLLDVLSDTLCQAIDLSEFIRTSGVSPAFSRAAEQVYERMFEFMNILNTSEELYQLLLHIKNRPDIWNSLDNEEKMVADILLYDFEKSGVNRGHHTRKQFIELSNRIDNAGRDFVMNAYPEKDSITLPVSQLSGIDPSVQSKLPIKRGYATVPTTGPIAHHIMSTADNADTRRELWLADRKTSDRQVSRLETLLKTRAELAQTLGFQSYGEYQLRDKMAKSPRAVKRFLQNMAKAFRPLAVSELQTLAAATNAPGRIEAWDRDYYLHKMISQSNSRTSNMDLLSSYLSIGTVMVGLSKLFNSLYGIRLVPGSMQQFETWDDSVCRLDVISENDERIGMIYCDLFSNNFKSQGPAHFTIRCSRRILDDPIESDYGSRNPLSLSVSSSGELHQLPTIVLVCGFNKSPTGLTLLSFYETETLFHEMGHAVHSMLGQTNLHNVAGTRSATDFVELPSILMEHLVSAPAVLQSFARHHRTNKPPSLELINAFKARRTEHLANCETYTQIMMAQLDQIFHSECANDPAFDSCSIYFDLQCQMGLYKPVPENRWHTYFTHLFGYGATYYSYLLDRAIASKIYTHLFEKDPLSREAGEKFANEVLKWGGSRDPWECVAGALDSPELSNGDDSAMLEIGSFANSKTVSQV
ncbi:hypothetical protein CANCADRAFT_32504 [Tortispora caseinolytica NRRL Y-17796]|uniref:Mitochondrial intermediate peptidase n=1 Tax=Tortispora caseinolytica NRRL Y-17796 TaxID=767744 RepID=A0A1E4TBQ2_9ASCO|nr:hypothetical protein CANCADRAFT_32504 [Tortispora caseinolytica NRRL Y-17796]